MTVPPLRARQGTTCSPHRSHSAGGTCHILAPLWNKWKHRPNPKNRVRVCKLQSNSVPTLLALLKCLFAFLQIFVHGDGSPPAPGDSPHTMPWHAACCSPSSGKGAQCIAVCAKASAWALWRLRAPGQAWPLGSKILALCRPQQGRTQRKGAASQGRCGMGVLSGGRAFWIHADVASVGALCWNACI